MGGVGDVVAWVHKILAWVAWVEILAWVKILSWVAWFKKTAWVNVLLSNHTLKRTRRLTYIIRYNCTTKRIQPSLQLSFVIPNLFRASLIQTYMWCIFRFSFLSSLECFLNCDYLFCLTCKNNKKIMKEHRAKRQRKKNIFNS